MRVAVIIDASELTAHTQVLPQAFQFPKPTTTQDAKSLGSHNASNRVSTFRIIA